LTGANGAGKTTLLRCLAGILRPTAGEARVFGRPAGADPESRRLVGMAAHESFLYPHLTALENLLFAARMNDVPQPRRRAEAMLESAALERHADRLASRLSKGMRQRLAVLRAVVHDPAVLLCDEPFAGLDAEGTAWLAGLFASLRARGRTLCFSTHDLDSARRLADRVVRIEAGRAEETLRLAPAA
jgi:ABC-type multidrug transport system ATPase subunit